METIETLVCKICKSVVKLSLSDPVHYTNWTLPHTLRTVPVCSEECKNIATAQAELDQRISDAKLKRFNKERRETLEKILGLFWFSNDPFPMHAVPEENGEVNRIISEIYDYLDGLEI